jgi:hypothetical protein
MKHSSSIYFTRWTLTMDFVIPEPLKVEHEELHRELAGITGIEGEIGEAAKTVAELLHPHFVKEEEYALPPLGLLSLLAGGQISADMASVYVMTDRLERELPEMLAEHRAIVRALEKLADVAKKENRLEFVHFSEKLMLHARTEEEVLYPAAILAGKYIKAIRGEKKDSVN